MRVRAAGVNFADLLARVGLYPDAPKPPCVVGYEVAGDVDALGEGVEELAIGQRVMGGCRFGGYAQLAVAGAGTLMPLPDGWSYAEGAALPVAYGTAYAGMVRFGGLHAGERVLIQAAAGGVGIAATQIAKLRRRRGVRHRLAVQARRDPRLRRRPPDRLPHARRGRRDAPGHRREAPARPRVRRDRREQLPPELLAPARGRAARLLRRLRGAGGRAAQPAAALRMLAQMPRYNPLTLMRESKSVIGLNMLRLWDEKGDARRVHRAASGVGRRGRDPPGGGPRIPARRRRRGHRFLHERKNVGKVVLTL